MCLLDVITGCFHVRWGCCCRFLWYMTIMLFKSVLCSSLIDSKYLKFQNAFNRFLNISLWVFSSEKNCLFIINQPNVLWNLWTSLRYRVAFTVLKDSVIFSLEGDILLKSSLHVISHLLQISNEHFIYTWNVTEISIWVDLI